MPRKERSGGTPRWLHFGEGHSPSLWKRLPVAASQGVRGASWAAKVSSRRGQKSAVAADQSCCWRSGCRESVRPVRAAEIARQQAENCECRARPGTMKRFNDVRKHWRIPESSRFTDLHPKLPGATSFPQAWLGSGVEYLDKPGPTMRAAISICNASWHGVPTSVGSRSGRYFTVQSRTSQCR